MKNYNKNYMLKKYLPLYLVILSIVLLLGTSYALLRSSQRGTNTYVMTVGLLEVTFVDSETNALTIENAVPISDEEGISQTDELEFTIKNTGDVPAIYNVYIEETSTSPEFKTVIRFISNKNDTGYNSPKTLSEDYYIDQEGTLNVGETATYKVKAWLDETADSTYMNKTFTARIVVDVVQGEIESESTATAADMIIAKYGTDSSLVAVNTDGTLYDGTGEIREYRYSGATANNYVIFNDDGDSTTEANELWRIVGVFKNSSDEWNLKLMRDTILTSDEVPHTYTVNGTAYTIDSISDSTVDYEITTKTVPGSFMTNNVMSIAVDPGLSNAVLWNSTSTTNYNDWTTAGLQYYLNTERDTNGTAGYYSTFTNKAKALIDVNYVYNLGNVVYDTDTTITAYNNERKTTVCASSVTTNSHNSNCNIWDGNQAIWNGKVALLYPSDYGYSADNSYWSGTTLFTYNSAAYAASWMSQTANHSTSEWLLSPSSSYSYSVTLLDWTGFVDLASANVMLHLRPSLNLIAGATMEDNHEGSITDPFVIIE